MPSGPTVSPCGRSIAAAVAGRRRRSRLVPETGVGRDRARGVDAADPADRLGDEDVAARRRSHGDGPVELRRGRRTAVARVSVDAGAGERRDRPGRRVDPADAMRGDDEDVAVRRDRSVDREPTAVVSPVRRRPRSRRVRFPRGPRGGRRGAGGTLCPRPFGITSEPSGATATRNGSKRSAPADRTSTMASSTVREPRRARGASRRGAGRRAAPDRRARRAARPPRSFRSAEVARMVSRAFDPRTRTATENGVPAFASLGAVRRVTVGRAASTAGFPAARGRAA